MICSAASDEIDPPSDPGMQGWPDIQGCRTLLLDQDWANFIAPPSFYTLQVDGAATLVFTDPSREGARRFAFGAGIRHQLVEMGLLGAQRDHMGPTIALRTAAPAEIRSWQRCLALALAGGEVLPDASRFAAFLVAAPPR